MLKSYSFALIKMKENVERPILISRAQLALGGEQLCRLTSRKEKLEHDLLILCREGLAYHRTIEEIRSLNFEIEEIKRINNGARVSEDKGLVDEMIHKQLRFGG